GERIAPGLVDVGAGVHELHGAGLVTQDDELHLLLIAHRLDPSGDADGAVGCGGEGLDEGVCCRGCRGQPWSSAPPPGPREYALSALSRGSGARNCVLSRT